MRQIDRQIAFLMGATAMVVVITGVLLLTVGLPQLTELSRAALDQ